MKTKKFLTMAALTMGLAMTGAMMTSCSNQDNPTVGPDEGVLPGGQTIVLSELESDYVAQDGDILTGTLDGNTQPYKISIADGATVSLSDATIQQNNTKNYPWAGITCLGDATIILDGENSVEGFDMDYPGIQPGPEGTTLTIKGEGKLTAIGGWNAAGIGSSYNMTCGNITIESGDITATGGAAGIGCGFVYSGTTACGDITITGGTVIATGEGGAGIGSGRCYDGTNICGDITISGGIVTATGFGAGIGSGQYGTCGNITIAGGIVTATSGENGAGIGCGDANFGPSVCGDITITGGTVIATGEGLGTGIGCGGCANFPSVCGDITIESGVGFVNVTAIKGVSAYKPIGFSLIDEGCVCGDIYFNDNLINSMKYWYDPKEDNYGGMIFTISSSEPGNPKKEGDTWTLTPAE